MLARRDARLLSPPRWCYHFRTERDCAQYYVESALRRCVWRRGESGGRGCQTLLPRAAKGAAARREAPRRSGGGRPAGAPPSTPGRTPHTEACGAQCAQEKAVAFFGAADGWAALLRQCVSLLSVARFHPHVGVFVLVPARRAAAWGAQLGAWGVRRVELVGLEAAAEAQFTRPRGSAYSAMTLHRLRMPELLGRRGYRFSVNVDPDVLCARQWDLRQVAEVEGISGRLVRQLHGLPSWLRQLPNASAAGAALARLLGVREAAVGAAVELNGGVVVFNNAHMRRVRWLELCAAVFATLSRARWRLEGDQDLVSCVLLAHPHVRHGQLHSEYNYGFGRDRELPLGHRIGRRLRYGLISGSLVNAHFVQDGKPWEVQNLSGYPSWKATARAAYLHEWLTVAYHLLANRTAARLRALFPLARGDVRPLSGQLHAILDLPTRQQCVCFLRALQREGEDVAWRVFDAELRLDLLPNSSRALRQKIRQAKVERVLAHRRRLERVLKGKKQWHEAAIRCGGEFNSTELLSLRKG
ncbi:hypothetical protein AB1Y20_006338 [Prymnesium parvum]|uniref:Uncharacterized protein n=1 Tax=Prymnesium parvum TaxID=97485 RepID=A0AB34J4U4_PRYPA